MDLWLRLKRLCNHGAKLLALVFLSSCAILTQSHYNPGDKEHQLLFEHISKVYESGNGAFTTLTGSLEQYFKHVESKVGHREELNHRRTKLVSISDQAYLSNFSKIQFIKQYECFPGFEDFEDDKFNILYDDIARIAALEGFILNNGAVKRPRRKFLATSTERQLNHKLTKMHKSGAIEGEPILVSYFLQCRGGPSFANHLKIKFPRSYEFVNLVPEFGHQICEKQGKDPFSSRCKYRRQYNNGDDDIDIIGTWRYQLVAENTKKESFVVVKYGKVVLKLQ